MVNRIIPPFNPTQISAFRSISDNRRIHVLIIRKPITERTPIRFEHLHFDTDTI